MSTIDVPPLFVFHSVGVESGLTLEDNIRSLEAQRKRNSDGIFYWGLGCSIAKATIEAMLEKTDTIKVLFCPISSTPRSKDAKGLFAEQKSIRVWTNPIAHHSQHPYRLPPEAQVVSHDQEKNLHYAFVCRSEKPLEITSNGAIVHKDELRTFPGGNVRGQGSAYAVQYTPLEEPQGQQLQFVMEAELVPPYIIQFKCADSRVIQGEIDWQTGQYPV